MTSPEIIREFTQVARERGLEPALLLAVAELETALRPFAEVEGRREPLIRFEGHYFDRRLSPANREIARQANLASPRAGGIANPASQAARWQLLDRAARIDRKAAYESVSWGLGQVMGAHWDWLGYASVDALAAEARSGIGGQVRLMVRFIDKSGLSRALRDRDWKAFARGYNGPAFHRNAYDERLAAAYRRHAVATGTTDKPEEPAIGASGEAVRRLQVDLGRVGFQLAADGMFGPATERAVRTMQQRSGLAPTGIACPRTMEAIAAAVPVPETPRRAVPRGIGLLNRLLARGLR